MFSPIWVRVRKFLPYYFRHTLVIFEKKKKGEELNALLADLYQHAAENASTFLERENDVWISMQEDICKALESTGGVSSSEPAVISFLLLRPCFSSPWGVFTFLTLKWLSFEIAFGGDGGDEVGYLPPFHVLSVCPSHWWSQAQGPLKVDCVIGDDQRKAGKLKAIHSVWEWTQEQTHHPLRIARKRPVWNLCNE